MSSSTTIPTVKFKKKKKKIMAKKRMDDDDNDDEESNNEHSLLSQAKKRRKLINSSQYQKGIDSQKLLTKTKIKAKKTDDNDDDESQTQQPADTKDKLFKTNFSSSNSNGPIETVMQQKHQTAMEEFIAKRMNHNHKDPTATEDNNKDDGVTHRNNTATITQDADQGAGGTMLGGTGIAEVILPLEQRLETVKKTHELLQKKQPKHPPSSRRKATTEMTTIPQTTPEEETSDPSVDDGRLGFQAMRHGAVNRKNNSEGQRQGHNNHASDSRVFKQFLKREGAKNRR